MTAADRSPADVAQPPSHPVGAPVASGARGVPPYAAAVFDMDGLLLDSERPVRSAWMDASAEFGVSLRTEQYQALIGLNHTDSQQRMFRLLGNSASLMSQVQCRAQSLLVERFGDRGFEVKSGARRLLKALREAGVPCAVASSTGCAEVRRRLQAAHLLDSFSAVCGGDEVTLGKPHPDLYRLALQRLDVRADRALAFEDSGPGVQAAWAAGLAVVAVPDLSIPAPLWQSRCLAVLASLEGACERSVDWFGVDCITAPG